MSDKPSYEELEQRLRELEKESEKLKHTEKVLRESENWWRNFLSHNVAGIWRFEFSKPMPLSLPVDEQIEWMMDRSVLVEVNNVAAKMYGFSSADDVVGKTYREIFEYDEKAGRETIQTWIKQGYKFDRYEDYRITYTGEYRWSMKISHSLIENDHIIGSWGTEVDITDRKLAEDALRESEKKYRQLVESTNDWVWSCDINGIHIFSNQAVKSFLGYEPHEIIGKSAFKFMHPEDRNRVQKMVQQAVNQKRGWQEDTIRWLHKDGGVRYVESRAEPILDTEGYIAGFSGIDRDVTERKRADEALRESEERYRLLVETMSDSLVVIDTDGLVTYANDRACEMWRRTRDDILGRPVSYFMDEANQLIFRQELEKRKKGEHGSYELTFTRKDGKKVPTLISPKPIFDADGRFAGSFAVITDITGLKRAEESLRENESRYRSIFESANDAIFIIRDDVFMDCNRKALEMFGCTREQIIGKPPYTFSPIDQPDGSVSQEKALEKIKAAYEGEPQIFEWRHTKYDGTPFDAQVGMNLVELSTGIHLQAIVRDITEKKSLDKQIRLMQHWVEQSVDLFFWVREDSHILYVNQAVCHFLGYTKKEFRTMKVSDFDLDLPLEAWPGFTQKLREKGSYCFETRHRKKNGQVFPVEITANILNFEGKAHFFAYGRDISAKVSAEMERKELENQLRQAQKMEAIGTLAGGIAHDFNNILSSIIGFTEISMREVPPGSKLEDNLQRVFSAGIRAGDLVKQILAFSRQSDREIKPVQVKPIAQETLKLIRASLPATVEIHQDLRSDSPIMADPTQVHQIIMNLCTNAAHAMRDTGGRLVVGLTDVELDADITDKHQDMAPGPFVKLTVSDSGHGMAPEIKDRIFDPFYTTKELGEGTGLGLSVVHGIVTDCGGMISLESTPGEGSTFNVSFPVIESEQGAEIVTHAPLPTGTERILFVDDEEYQVEMGKQILELLGYRVTAETSSEEALKVFRSKPDEFDLVVTDLTMPKMTGDVLAKEIMAIRSDVPIILCTGYSEKITPAKAKTLGIKEVVMKPAVVEEIARTVRMVLDRH